MRYAVWEDREALVAKAFLFLNHLLFVVTAKPPRPLELTKHRCASSVPMPSQGSGVTLPAAPPEFFSEEKNYTKRAPGATLRLPLSIVNSDAVYATMAIKMRVEVQEV